MRRCSSAAALAAALLVTGSAFAQQYPSKPVRIVVPFAPAGQVEEGHHRGEDPADRRVIAEVVAGLWIEVFHCGFSALAMNGIECLDDRDELECLVKHALGGSNEEACLCAARNGSRVQRGWLRRNGERQGSTRRDEGLS